MRVLLRSTLLLLATAALAGATPTGTPDHYRVVIMTDMTHDDGNSLIRYLYYTPWFETDHSAAFAG